MSRNYLRLRYHRGLSLVELMVSLVIGLLIVLAVMQAFVGIKRSFTMQEDLARIQENGRFAIELLKKDIRSADFWGCQTGFVDNIVNHLNEDVDPGLYGFSDGVSGAEASGVTANTVANVTSDSITLNGAGGFGISLVSPYNDSAQIFIEDQSGLLEDEIVLVTDCEKADLFQITNDPGLGNTSGFDNLVHVQTNSGIACTGVQRCPGNQTANWLPAPLYGEGAMIFKTSGPVTYSITLNNGEYDLTRTGINGTERLVQGVESMQVLYGVDSDNDLAPDSYVTATTAAANMEDVVSVKISLLLRGFADNVTNAAMTFDYPVDTAASNAVTASDRRLRKLFTTTVAIRNRLN